MCYDDKTSIIQTLLKSCECYSLGPWLRFHVGVRKIIMVFGTLYQININNIQELELGILGQKQYVYF